MTDTVQLMMDHLIPADKQKEDTPNHKTTREQTKQTLYITVDMEFKNDEVRLVIECLQSNKAPGTNGITNEIMKLVFKEMSNTITSIYNACLRT